MIREFELKLFRSSVPFNRNTYFHNLHLLSSFHKNDKITPLLIILLFLLSRSELSSYSLAYEMAPSASKTPPGTQIGAPKMSAADFAMANGSSHSGSSSATGTLATSTMTMTVSSTTSTTKVSARAIYVGKFVNSLSLSICTPTEFTIKSSIIIKGKRK